MADNEQEPLAARPPLGPGDDDPNSPAISAADAGVASPGPALGPGDDDPRSPARGAPLAAAAPLAPGAAAGENPDDNFDFLAPPPAAPGAIATTRHLVRIPKRRAPKA